jgi:outer membrane receptor protein involved in Fe transport
VHINGNPYATETGLIDGMDNTNIMAQESQQENAPSQDSIQEFTIQTSNYSAEYGQTGGSVVNMVMKSGTNQFHGSLYEYLQNADLNGGVPFTNNGNGQLSRPQTTRNDYGFTVGGPVWIPKVYNGRNKTFWFFGWEQYIQDNNYLPSPITIPTAAYQAGNFSAAIPAAGNHVLGTDPTGATIFANEIFDPATRQTVNGQVVTSPFPNNTVPATRFDPVSLKMQALYPSPICVAGGVCNTGSVINNFQNTEYLHRSTFIPSLKLDQIIGTKDKLSFYWSRTGSYCLTCYGEDGLPQPISDTFGAGIYSHDERLNYDHTITPTILLHLGVGFNRDDLGRPSVTPQYNVCPSVGLCSQAFTGLTTFPDVTGLLNTLGGGATYLGPPARADDLFSAFNNIASLTWVKGNHTYKFGGSLNLQGFYVTGRPQESFAFSAAETAEPYLSTITAGAGAAAVGAYSLGFPYASFLLGAVDHANIDPTYDARYGKHQLGLYAQDSWKITPKFTLDYGLRYDYSTYYTEQYGRSPQFDPTLPNPSAGGQPGATIYQATCHCAFAHNYPLAFAPRLGFAYQATKKTVLRGGFGIVYSGVGAGALFTNASGSASASNPFGPTVPGQGIMTWGQGVTIGGQPLTAAQIAWPNLSSGYYPIGGVVPGTGPQYMDQNAGRPVRQYQYSFTVQREIASNLVVDASYVGNRGVWWPTYNDSAGAMENFNWLSPQLLSHYGLSLSNPADLTILLSPLNSPNAGPFEGHIPFTGFPLTATVAQSLRPFPQFNAGLGAIEEPIGETWYNSLQTAVNKRFSHGLQGTFAFAWSKSLTSFCGTSDPEDYALAKCIGEYDQPFMTRFTIDYRLPKWGPKVVSQIVRDWTMDAFAAYTSGLPLAAPVATAAGPGYSGALASATMANLTYLTNQYQLPTGQPYYNVNINCHCFDPNKTIVLNPAAWANPAPGQIGGPEYEPGFRQQRRPIENFGIGRVFRIKEERYSLSVRAEFTNIFNRTQLVNPGINTATATGNSPQTAPTCYGPTGAVGACTAGESYASGFGWINTATSSGANLPRSGQLVARFTF